MIRLRSRCTYARSEPELSAGHKLADQCMSRVEGDQHTLAFKAVQ